MNPFWTPFWHKKWYFCMPDGPGELKVALRGSKFSKRPKMSPFRAPFWDQKLYFCMPDAPGGPRWPSEAENAQKGCPKEPKFTKNPSTLGRTC